MFVNNLNAYTKNSSSSALSLFCFVVSIRIFCRCQVCKSALITLFAFFLSSLHVFHLSHFAVVGRMCYLLCNYPHRPVRFVLKSLVKAQAHISANGVLNLQSATREPFKLWHCVLMRCVSATALLFSPPILSSPVCVLQLCSVPLSSVMERIIALMTLRFQCRTALIPWFLDNAELKDWEQTGSTLKGWILWKTEFSLILRDKRDYRKLNLKVPAHFKNTIYCNYMLQKNPVRKHMDCWCKFINIWSQRYSVSNYYSIAAAWFIIKCHVTNHTTSPCSLILDLFIDSHF